MENNQKRYELKDEMLVSVAGGMVEDGDRSIYHDVLRHYITMGHKLDQLVNDYAEAWELQHESDLCRNAIDNYEWKYIKSEFQFILRIIDQYNFDSDAANVVKEKAQVILNLIG